MMEKTSLLENKGPYTKEIEQAVIASLLIDKEVLGEVAESVSIDDFYYDLHKEIVSTILTLYEENTPIDLITVNNKLSGKTIFIQGGGAEYLDDIVNTLPTSANAEYYIKILKEKAELRRLIKVCTDLIKEANSESDRSDDLIDRAESKIFEIANKRIGGGFEEIKPALSEAVDHIEMLYHSKNKITGIPSKFFDLDSLTGGFQASDLIILAARPSMGKTAFALNLTENIALNTDTAIAFFSLEMSKSQLCQRLISSNSGVDSQKIRTGKLEKSDFYHITDSVSLLSTTKIFIDDTPSITPLEIRAKARRLASQENLSLIIIDYLQLISIASTKRTEGRQNEIAEISRSLKTLARELNITILALSQLSRQVEIRGGDHRPRLSDLRDSGALEQDADIVLFIYRDEYYNPNNEEVKGTAELIVAKQRNGPTGVVNLLFNPSLARFNNLQKDYK